MSEKTEALFSGYHGMASAAKRVLALAPLGLPEDVATLYGIEAAEALQIALDDLREEVARYEA